MEKLMSLYVFSLLSLVLVTSNANVTPEAYWNSVLPNSPMPKALKNILYSGGSVEEKVTPDREKLYVGVNRELFAVIHNHAASEEQVNDSSIASLFSLETDIHQGGKLNLVLNKNPNPEAKLMLSRQVADSIPFSSDELPKIYQHFSVDPNSMEASVMKDTIKLCHQQAAAGDGKYCATSLESMIDFSTNKLGNKVMALSTEEDANTKETTSLQTYIIHGVQKLASDNNVVCHKLNYPNAVFYCHKSLNSSAYVISLVNPVDGTKVKAVSVCHRDTSKWNPKHLAFQVLKVSPGSVPVCHFVAGNNVVWVPY